LKLNKPDNFRSNKPSILFIHGFASNHHVFDTNIAVLTKNFNCFTLDLFAGIHSSATMPNVHVEHFALQIVEELKKLQLASLTICGHSYGGQIAIHAAAHSPGLIEQLILIAPSGIETFNQFEQMMAQPFIPWAARQISGNAEDFLRFAFRNYSKDAHAFVSKISADYISQTGKHIQSVTTKVFAEIISAPTFSLLQKITKPALIIFGEVDQIIPNMMAHPFLSTRIIAANAAKQLPCGSFKLIPHSGHFVMWEQGALVNELIYKFAYTSTVIQPSLQ